MSMKIVTIVGARPQFIKAAPVSLALRAAGVNEYLVHTGQHYDYGMSQIFFDELGIPQPDVNLNVGSGSHGRQTGQMLAAIEDLLLAEKPDWLLVYGDTNSTLAGALAAVKLHIPIAHVEAGLRSFNRAMPEEHNRVLTDHCADMLFCPTETAVYNLQRENITQGVYHVGDTMYDAVLRFADIAAQKSTILSQLDIQPKQYLLATLHRPYNTDNPDNLRNILTAFLDSDERIIFPVHPRARQKIADLPGLNLENSNVKMIPPVGYLDMLQLERHSRKILTDSGGIQKEAYFFAVPCVTLRPETEWVETVEAGWNHLVGADRSQIAAGIRAVKPPDEEPPTLFGNGQTAKLIVELLRRTPLPSFLA
jgi:UDP-N-acetylglucosamine 2-epimerase